MKRFFLFLFIFLVLSSNAYALKVSSRLELDFEPNLEYEGSICIIPENTPHLTLAVQGGLKDYIEMDTTDISLVNGPSCLPYTIKLPTEMDRPGRHTGLIKVTEKTTGSGTIAAIVGVGHQIWINVPYPGKYLDIGLGAHNVEEGDSVKFSGSVKSKGDQAINIIRGDILIYNWKDELIDQIETNEVKNLASQQSAELRANWNTEGQEIGDYYAVLKVWYDGKEDEASKDFKIGSIEVRMTGHMPKLYKKGIVPFEIYIESYWSEDIPGVSAHVDILNATAEVFEFDTLVKSIQPWTEDVLKGFVDTTSIPVGNYTLNITLFYTGMQTNYQGSLEIVEEPKVNIEEPNGNFISSYFNSPRALLMTTLILSLFTLVLAMKVLFGGKKKKEEPKEDIPRESEEQGPFVGNF